MNILFINLPYHGHVIPTIGLVQALIKAGHQVMEYMQIWENQRKIQKEIAQAPGNTGAVGIIEAYYGKQ